LEEEEDDEEDDEEEEPPTFVKGPSYTCSFVIFGRK